jgi:hypothetical protein
MAAHVQGVRGYVIFPTIEKFLLTALSAFDQLDDGSLLLGLTFLEFVLETVQGSL